MRRRPPFTSEVMRPGQQSTPETVHHQQATLNDAEETFRDGRVHGAGNAEEIFCVPGVRRVRPRSHNLAIVAPETSLFFGIPQRGASDLRRR